MADTVAVMNKGEIEQMGAPEELYELPRTAFVANFLGQSNLFTGRCVVVDGRRDRRRRRRARVEVPRERAQRHAGEVTDRRATREARAASRASRRPAPGRNISAPAASSTSRSAGVSTQYLVAVPGSGS